MNNIYQQQFFATQQIDENNKQTTLILDKGTLIVDKTQIQITILIPNFTVRFTLEGDATDLYTRADAVHGSQLKFYVMKERPIGNLSQVLVQHDSEIVLQTDNLKALQSQNYQSKYRQQCLLMNDYIYLNNNINATINGDEDNTKSLIQNIGDIMDITNYTAQNCTTLNYSIPISDFLPLCFLQNEINIMDQLQITLNFQDMLNLFFISGCGYDYDTIGNNNRFLNNYQIKVPVANDFLLINPGNIKMDLKVNALYRVQPDQQIQSQNKIISNNQFSKNYQSNLKVQDNELSMFQSFSLQNPSFYMWHQNQILQDQLKIAVSSVQFLKNNRQIANNQQLTTYTGQRITQYLINLLNLANDNNNQNCKNIGQLTNKIYQNKLFQYRMFLTGNNALTPQYNLYISYIKFDQQ